VVAANFPEQKQVFVQKEKSPAVTSKGLSL
jgi:hypothetical protein